MPGQFRVPRELEHFADQRLPRPIQRMRLSGDHDLNRPRRIRQDALEPPQVAGE